MSFNDCVDTEFLSKNKQKKLDRYNNEVDRRKSRRKQEQEKQREKFKQLRQEGGPSKEELKRCQRSRLAAALETGVKVCVDFQFEDHMTEKELNRFANQAKRVYGSNKSSEEPFNLHFINLKKSSKTFEMCCDKNDGFERYLLHFHEEGIEDLFDPNKVVYLSPDSETALVSLDPEAVYIIGGLVDDSVRKDTSRQFSQAVGITTARLPIPEHMERAETGTFKQILTINQVFDVLLDFHENDPNMNIGVRTEWEQNISQKFLWFQRENLLTDLTFVCCDGKVEAHRLVLASFSDLLHQLLLESDESFGVISLPELSAEQVKCFIGAVYKGAPPQNKQELSSAILVFNLLVDSVPVKNESDRPQTSINIENKLDIDLDLSVVSAEASMMDLEGIADDPLQPSTELNHSCTENMTEPEHEEEEPKASAKPSAINMTPEERLQRSNENLEKSCKFCFESVVSHRVSLKVKQERNNSYHLKNQYVCCVCGLVLNTPSNFIAHNNNEFSKCESSGKIPSLWQFGCNLCAKTICQHQLSQQSYICCHCGEEFGSPGVLTIHLKTINTLNITECHVCKVALPKTQLKKHLAQHHPDSASVDALQPAAGGGGELQPCQDCHKFSKASKKEKMAHYRANHSEYHASVLKHNNQVWKSAPSSQYTFCDICNKSIRKCNLKEHKLHTHGLNMANETVDLPTFTCDICGQISKYAKDVKKHKKLVHERVLPFACQYCGKKFSNKGNLNQHEVIHTGITPYQCHVCGRQCRRRGELEKHIQTHNGLGSLHQLEPGDVFLVDSQVDTERNISQLPVLVPGASPGAGGHSLQLVSGHQLPIIMTQLDADSLRQMRQSRSGRLVTKPAKFADTSHSGDGGTMEIVTGSGAKKTYIVRLPSKQETASPQTIILHEKVDDGTETNSANDQNNEREIAEFSLSNIPIDMVDGDADKTELELDTRMTLADQLALLQSGAQLASLEQPGEMRDHVISIEENGSITIEKIGLEDSRTEDGEEEEEEEDLETELRCEDSREKSPHTPPKFPEWWLRLSSTLLSFLSTGHLVDVWLVCCDGEAVPAHQLLLSQVSPRLAGWLVEARKEAQDEAVTISLPDWDSDTVGQFVSALYQGQLPPARTSQKKIRELADMFGIPQAKPNTRPSKKNTTVTNEAGTKEEKDKKMLFMKEEGGASPGKPKAGKDTRAESVKKDQLELGEGQVQVVQTENGEILLLTGDLQLQNQKVEQGQSLDDEVEKMKAVKIAQIKEQQSKQCPLCYNTAINHRHNYDGTEQKFAYKCCQTDCTTDNLKTARAFNQHVVKHSESMNYEPASRVCPLCLRPRIEHKNRGLSDEEKTSHRGNLYKCCHCAASKLSAKKFFLHMENHVSKKHVCSICNKGYSYKHLLNEHTWKEHGDGQNIRFPCNWEGCDYSAKYKQTLHTHVMERHHGVKRKHRQEDAYKKINCPTCNKSLKKWYYHQFHKRTCSSGNVIYQCEICGKEGFINAVTLQNHVRTKHSVDRPFSCEYCPAKYATAMSLSGHRSRKHGVNSKGEVVPKKLFPCNVCGKLLTSRMKLQAHVEVIHEGRRDFKCQYCDKTFTSKSNVQIHEGSLHTGVLPYKCEFCNKMFARRNQLQSHRESQHPGHAGPFYVVEDVNSVQVEDIIIPVESVEDGVEISVGVDSVNIMEGVAIA